MELSVAGLRTLTSEWERQTIWDGFHQLDGAHLVKGLKQLQLGGTIKLNNKSGLTNTWIFISNLVPPHQSKELINGMIQAKKNSKVIVREIHFLNLQIINIVH